MLEISCANINSNISPSQYLNFSIEPNTHDVIIQYSTSSPTVQITFLENCHKVFHVFHVHALKNVVWEHHMFRNGPFLSTSANPSQAKGLTEGGELMSLSPFSHS
jgi:hypothetical protein